MKNKIIDLSVIAGSSVLCEFSKHLPFRFNGRGFLVSIDEKSNYPYLSDLHQNNRACRVLENHWISNAERSLVLPDGLLVDAIYVSFEGERFCVGGEMINGNFFVNTKSDYKICNAEHIRVEGTADGYCYAWESE